MTTTTTTTTTTATATATATATSTATDTATATKRLEYRGGWRGFSGGFGWQNLAGRRLWLGSEPGGVLWSSDEASATTLERSHGKVNSAMKPLQPIHWTARMVGGCRYVLDGEEI
jgi:hypothetical protein